MTNISDRGHTKSGSTDITSDLGIIVSATHDVTRNMEKIPAVNSGADFAYLQDTVTEINISQSIESDSFAPLQLIGEVSGNELILPDVLPEFTFENQADKDNYVEITEAKWGTCNFSFGVDENLVFEFIGFGKDITLESGTLAKIDYDLKPLRGQSIIVKINDTAVGELQSFSGTIERGLENVYAVGWEKDTPKHIAEGLKNISITDMTLNIDDTFAWTTVFGGTSITDRDNDDKVEIVLPNGEIMLMEDVGFDDTDPEDQTGDDGVRSVSLSGEALSLKIQNWGGV